MPKLCKDCKHFSPDKWGFHKCLSPKLSQTDPVTGEVRGVGADTERSFGGPIMAFLYGWCGRPGRYWEAKDA